MTARQIELARHALEEILRDGRVKVVSVDDLFDLVGPMRGLTRGTAEQRVAQLVREAWNKLPAVCDGFSAHLTRSGAERALMPGDVLDPEDWP